MDDRRTGRFFSGGFLSYGELFFSDCEFPLRLQLLTNVLRLGLDSFRHHEFILRNIDEVRIKTV